jgi:hypothetical protein
LLQRTKSDGQPATDKALPANIAKPPELLRKP